MKFLAKASERKLEGPKHIQFVFGMGMAVGMVAFYWSGLMGFVIVGGVIWWCRPRLKLRDAGEVSKDFEDKNQPT